MSSDSKEKQRAEKEFQLDRTRDGSVSLKHSGGETMHSRDGALSETDYIYYPVVRSLLQQASEVNCCILGLGLAYIEFGIIAEWIKAERRLPLKILSYELSLDLRESLRSWAGDLVTISENSPAHSLYSDQFDEAARLVADRLKVSIEDLKESACHLLRTGNWIVAEAITPEKLQNAVPFLSNGIFYDAFSGKTDGYLWSETFLIEFLNSHAQPDALFSTYAAVGTLNRSLRVSGFTRIARKGFSYKRESTWATKGTLTFKSPEL